MMNDTTSWAQEKAPLKEVESGEFIFEVNIIERYVLRFLNTFLIVTWILSVFFELFDGSQIVYPKSAFHVVLPIGFVIGVFATAVHWNFAYKIVFNLGSDSVVFFMAKRKPIITQISKIDSFLMGYFPKFIIGDNTVYFRGYDCPGFVTFVDALEKKSYPVKWSKLGKQFTNKV